MKRNRFSESQIFDYLKEVEAGLSVSVLCRREGIGESTFYKWRQKYAGLTLPQVRQVRSLLEENGKLKRLLGQAHFEISVIKEVMSEKF